MSSLAEFMNTKRRVEVLDRHMAYVERGEGPSIVFLHGNPTSSMLWREVIPQVAHLGRCIAPDLIGMGDRDKRDGEGTSYRFVEHRRYLDAFMDAIDVGDGIVLMVHDWGSALGFDWARRHPDRVRGIAYTEAIVAPITWGDWPEAGARVFQALRSDAGERLVLQENMFVERILPGAILRDLSEEELAAYRRPFASPRDRWPTLQWPRELPIEGEPADVVEIVEAYGQWLQTAPVPKLFFDADPGSILTGRLREFCRTWANQTVLTVPGLHYVPEDSGTRIGQALAEWIPRETSHQTRENSTQE